MLVVLTSTKGDTTMKRLHIASIGLTAVLALGAASVATMAYGDAPSADPNARSVSVDGQNDTGPQESQPAPSKETPAKASLPAARLMGHFEIAPVCQNPAGPIPGGPACPMGIILPVGSPRHVLSALRRIGRSGTLNDEPRKTGAKARSGLVAVRPNQETQLSGE